MTGFGRARAEAGSCQAEVTLRCVNHRHLDVALRLSPALEARERFVRATLRRSFARGRIEVRIRTRDEAGLAAEIDIDAIRAHVRLLDDLRRASGVEAAPDLGHLLQFKGIFRPAESDEEAAWSAAEKALSLAVAELRTMRLREGVALRADLKRHADGLARRLSTVEEVAPERLPRMVARLRSRLSELDADDRVDELRLAQEIALFADRLDVNEECVRLRSHLEEFLRTLERGGAVGRRLEFIAQEMGRETTTIGSKAHDAAIAHLVVGMKEDLERMREQLRNVE